METDKNSFTFKLLDNAVNYEPLITTPDTQMHLGFWSGPGNHGSLVRLLDSINFDPEDGCLATTPSPNCAVWDEGATSEWQYPSYVQMLEEHWYERGNAFDHGTDTVTIYGKTYENKRPLTFHQADEIWGQYSERYADMAREFARTTGLPAKAWCFVIGASKTRIFYTFELPELEQLESEGIVKVFFAKTQDADWKKSDDWIEGTANAPNPITISGEVPPRHAHHRK